MLKKAKYIIANTNDIIVREGDYGNEMYIIIKGSASVYRK